MKVRPMPKVGDVRDVREDGTLVYWRVWDGTRWAVECGLNVMYATPAGMRTLHHLMLDKEKESGNVDDADANQAG